MLIGSAYSLNHAGSLLRVTAKGLREAHRAKRKLLQTAKDGLMR